ncbi:TylF/MycF/NovP-related O-methyltransferase [Rhodospirillum rubrum]|uniref:Uncharacterized protein n=1 Tax=Rhodospirillum rubrum (strain ATCC 11170 / ATH 1.1.1 / DSM 467 / LMG 4362 / NCIMB 8255 / S1) TaxID=269796 RepID=Q2RUB7_RHORT|nr:TylF/MycF/NovP-related O-methyltransferase [Rhodospirillum rubrum]ABC22278.1 hypothetical protein Rru_A1477 [Rhodospirillum rubrum ATCC 11170]AEO47996.1 hypothetical protein F11_07630 [Rhodospirillum rubrum F11]MBK5953846.1 hypothetical protein [Rhodospirillum rubrum]QXG81919.1 TylF/MycF family methyltransferase [Rhodospirillum rubrum]HAP99852.1 hypothetical protein [Rhodospirillum rubrum]
MRIRRWLRRQAEKLTRCQITHLGPVDFPLREGRPTDVNNVEILGDRVFRAALDACLDWTCLDTPRLATLWQLSRSSNPAGAIAEIGTFRGGAALLLGLANPGRPLFVCDTFAGFAGQPIDPRRDRLFNHDQFHETSAKAVDVLLGRHLTDYTLVEGVFPDSDSQGRVKDLSFVHLDVDIYDATRRCLKAVLPRCLPRALIVIDDYRRGCAGVDEAVAEVLADDAPDWLTLPLYPGQALLIGRGWFP